MSFDDYEKVNSFLSIARRIDGLLKAADLANRLPSEHERAAKSVEIYPNRDWRGEEHKRSQVAAKKIRDELAAIYRK